MKFIYAVFLLIFTANTALGNPILSQEEKQAYASRIEILATEANERVGHHLQCSMYLRLTADDPNTRSERFTTGFRMEREARVILTEIGLTARETDVYIYIIYSEVVHFLNDLNLDTACSQSN